MCVCGGGGGGQQISLLSIRPFVRSCVGFSAIDEKKCMQFQGINKIITQAIACSQRYLLSRITSTVNNKTRHLS